MNHKKIKNIELAWKVLPAKLFQDKSKVDKCLPTYGNTKEEAIQNYSEIRIRKNDKQGLGIRRYSEFDIVEYNGERMRRADLSVIFEKEKWIESRTKRINSFPANTEFYVQIGEEEGVAYWKGYEEDSFNVNEARVFSKKEILDFFIDGERDNLIWNKNHIIVISKPEVFMKDMDIQYLS